MKKIIVTASKTYDITLGTGILDDAGSVIRQTVGGQTAAIVTDDNVAPLYENRLANSLEANNYRVARYVFPHGEASKRTENFLELLDFLAREKLGRADVVVALGGGVAGDLAGFAAACYMRGIRFVQIPTTLLAAVDSSVGGKTAINLSAGKNLAGAFYQPDAVICDVSLLCTLTKEVFRDGCAEVIKYGAIADRALFDSLNKPIDSHLEEVITRCVEIKRDIVAEDEYENGVRKLLNFGHTVGHAIELLSGYQTSHGHAVAAGMAIVTRAAVSMGMCTRDCLDSLLRILRLYELPDNTSYDADSIARACLSDKKRDGDSITMIFPVEIGKCVLKKIPARDLQALIQSGMEV
ncbi:MAG: 3-dehydroquinate synthase [Oscillospiraceae bacterium]|nr:3-dehydroquinate synthase [Oscillospiraceae bacterium]